MKELIGGALGFIWFGFMTLVLAVALATGWLYSERPPAGQAPQTNMEEAACVIWKDLGKPCS